MGKITARFLISSVLCFLFNPSQYSCIIIGLLGMVKSDLSLKVRSFILEFLEQLTLKFIEHFRAAALDRMLEYLPPRLRITRKLSNLISAKLIATSHCPYSLIRCLICCASFFCRIENYVIMHPFSSEIHDSRISTSIRWCVAGRSYSQRRFSCYSDDHGALIERLTALFILLNRNNYSPR